MRFGMSEKLGPRVFGHDHGQPFLGREFSSEPDYSDDVAREIDGEIRRIVEEAHQLARRILEQHRDQLDNTSEILLRRETIERDAVPRAARRQGRGRRLRARRADRAAAAPSCRRRQERKPEREGAAAASRAPGYEADLIPSRRDGRGERHARFVLRRWPVPLRRRRGGACGGSWWRRGRRSSTWAARARARAPIRFPSRTELERVVPVVERVRGGGASPSTRATWPWPRPRSRRGRGS